jgi:UDP-N-acetylglucosamine--N-acetylmuramyl-(pentapeptide) pyrophosphoryl-undecaprenol N-acetylglucosamine transferase
MPLRREIVDLDRAASREAAAAYFGLDLSRPTLLVFGGSLGALRLNDAFAGSWQDVLDAGWQLIHATGEKSDHADPGVAGYAQVRYIDRMDLAFAMADLIVSRSGAATVSEVSALGIPAVYVPYAVGNGEQSLNARSAVAAGAARLIPDAEFTADRVRSEIVPLLRDDAAVTTMRDAAVATGIRRGTENVIALIDRSLQGR